MAVNVAAAVALSLFAPGAGQFYNGDYVKAAVFAAVFSCGLTVLAPLAARALRSRGARPVLLAARAANTVYASFAVISVADAGWRAWRAQTGGIDWRQLVFAALFGVIIAGLARNLKAPALVNMIAGMEGFSDMVLGRFQEKK